MNRVPGTPITFQTLMVESGSRMLSRLPASSPAKPSQWLLPARSASWMTSESPPVKLGFSLLLARFRAGPPNADTSQNPKRPPMPAWTIS